jgi:hypothetical protein
MRSDDPCQMSGHARTGDEDLHSLLLGSGDVLRGFVWRSMGGQDANVARNVESIQDIASLEHHGKVAWAPG